MTLVALDEAQRHVLSRVGVLPTVSMPLASAIGRVLASDVVASEPVPPFANTAMDGYAVRAADTTNAPVELKVVATLAAGAANSAARPVGPGEAIRIMTGAPMPPGADAIVMVERTRGRDATVEILAPADVGDHVRPAGEDISPGDLVFSAGDDLGPGHLGVLASLGVESVTVVRPARVGVLSTGDELTQGPGPLRPGQIRDSNRRTLLALAGLAGAEAVDLGIVRDDENALTAAVSSAASSCDALLTSGGVSVGDFDYVKVVLDKLSEGSMRWMQVAIRPAKPFAFGTVNGMPVFGLPGNPVSSMVSFECFARPALRKMMGHASLWRPTVRAVADEALSRRADGKLLLMRVLASWPNGEGRCHVRSSGGQGSNLLRAMAIANALALVPDGSGVPAGGEVDVWLLD
ncbi:MAG TPA: gephyrin-like molybdotransferase Glp [Acidimicrobiales bacterium]|nr:gephyrin-like molybdotransferase Glp [Acidimicrobiales bacterium]